MRGRGGDRAVSCEQRYFQLFRRVALYISEVRRTLTTHTHKSYLLYPHATLTLRFSVLQDLSKQHGEVVGRRLVASHAALAEVRAAAERRRPPPPECRRPC